MPTFAILLLLIGAILHTTWNLVIKQADDKFIATWWVVAIGGIASALALALTGLPPLAFWPFVLSSVLVETAYFLALSRAYRDHDFSLVYPIARGAAPAFLAVWSFLFLRERPTPGGLLGLALIIGGLMVIGSSALAGGAGGRLHLGGAASALGVAVLISIYTVIDGTAVKRVPALPYAFLIFALLPLPLMPFVARQYGWKRLREAWDAGRVRLLAAGVLGVGAYLFALAAYSIAPLNYSGAIREVSVVIGAFAGWRLLGERLG
ncbi:MAG: EamA family transporter, partial [Bacteroidota bacterium]